MTRWYQSHWWISDQRWFHVERPFPWPLIVSLVALVAVVAVVAWIVFIR